MTWIKSAELESLRARVRRAKEDIQAARAALNAGMQLAASAMTQLDPVAPLAEKAAQELKAERVRTNKAERELSETKAQRDMMCNQLDSTRADLAEVRKVLDTANGGPVGLLVGYSVGGNVNAKVALKSAAVTAAEHLAKRVGELADKVKAQREELDAIEHQRAQEAVDAEYAALPDCAPNGWFACPKCDREVVSPRLSDDADQNPQSAEMYSVITLAALASQGAVVTVGHAKPKLPQHLVWRCVCGHTVRTKTRDAS
ncbi:coiled-coil domain-containing protein [Mycobacteroides immunogenum]|uniref:Uncharacterized protein n=1 Tax=Mycobacteroides immunogenum TaxID=83262 RepID=A0A7V8RUC6_9MYCO|nr:hypothetical protein [Mycobacteroides immunogenum]AMT71946.1 hypothetical protein ABG82_18260 [Mycobacteroides immunogenum]ANO05078.1 hypothetical protein BAB75_18545 [Mycobacteroides immunogenum]KIU40248.1 hypothetical protein TL11_13420 [Mycobacteroides immunogenum]KPG02842.1 hypothetical protein AN909_26410 [Mycobacteroides immunogenum]KPG02930.1 hypothetical protein AN908_26860 [Mycobacteroides immunogenum]